MAAKQLDLDISYWPMKVWELLQNTSKTISYNSYDLNYFTFFTLFYSSLMSPTDFFIEVLLNSFGLWLIRQLYDNDQAPAGRRRFHGSWFSKSLFPSINSCFVIKKFSFQQQRPWMETGTSLTTMTRMRASMSRRRPEDPWLYIISTRIT